MSDEIKEAPAEEAPAPKRRRRKAVEETPKRDPKATRGTYRTRRGFTRQDR